jgi:hypothetical protein
MNTAISTSSGLPIRPMIASTTASPWPIDAATRVARV